MKLHRLRLTGIALLIVITLSLAMSGFLDNISQKYTDQAMQRSLIAFGVARGLNGIISVVQGTEIAVHPAGFGVNFTPGQVLDPINDLIEQFSWVLLLSTTSLGIQKLFLTIGSTLTTTLLFTVSLLLVLYMVWRPSAVSPKTRRVVIVVAVFFAFIRFSVPVSTILGQGIYQGFLSADYKSATQSLERSRDSFGDVKNDPGGPEPGSLSVLDEAKRYLNSAKNALDYQQKIEKYQALAIDISHSAIKLVVVFVTQSIILPLLFLWMIGVGLKLVAGQLVMTSYMVK